MEIKRAPELKERDAYAMVGGNGATSLLVARELDRLVRDLVDDVERLERPARPRRLLNSSYSRDTH